MRQQRRWYSPCHANSGMSRRGSTAHVSFLLASYRGRESIPVSFSFILLLPSLSRPFPPFPLLLPYPLLSRGCASLPLFRTPLVSHLLSLPHLPFSYHCAVSLSFRDRVAHPPFPLHALDVNVPPPPGTDERTSPSRITPRPRERSVTTKVLVKS